MYPWPAQHISRKTKQPLQHRNIPYKLLRQFIINRLNIAQRNSKTNKISDLPPKRKRNTQPQKC